MTSHTQHHFHGSIPALITPMKDGVIDEAAAQRFIEWQINSGSNAVVACGTTGESATLSFDEHNRMVALTVETAAGRVPVIAGAGSSSTAAAIAFAEHAGQAGADGLLVVVPYYNKPSQEGLYQHFKAIHDASDLPILIYNIPSRSVVDMSVETMARLAELPRIVGVKDATNDLARPLKQRRAIGAGFIQLSGDDATVLAYLAQGGDGCISVTANVAPALSAALHAAWRDGNIAEAQRLNNLLYPLSEALFCEASPGPVKYAAARLGLCNAETRLPLVAISQAAEARVDAALRHAGLLD